MDLFHIQMLFIVISFALTAFTALAPVLLVWRKSQQHHGGQALMDTSKLEPIKSSHALKSTLTLSNKTQVCLSFANAFACGVFLAMCVVNLIPSSNATWQRILSIKTTDISNKTQNSNDKYGNHEKNQHGASRMFPWSEFLTLVGFTIIFVIEMYQRITKDGICDSSIDRKINTKDLTSTEETESCIQRPTHLPSLRIRSMPSCCSHHAEDDCDAELVDTEEFDNNYVSLSELKEHSLVASTDTLKGSPATGSPMTEYGSLTTKFQDKSSFCEGTRSPARGRLYIKNRKITQHSSHNPFDKYIDHKSSFAVKHFGNRNNFFLLLTISIHNVFEGVTLGLQNDIADAMSIFIGISLHACLLSLVVSLATLRSWVPLSEQSMKKLAMILVTMCVFRPLGIFFGLLVKKLDDGETNIMSAILMSLSTGVFLHVTFISLIPAEFSHSTTLHCSLSNQDATVSNSDTTSKDPDITCNNIFGFAVKSFLHLVETPEFNTILKAFFFVCGWLAMTILTFIFGHHRH